MWLSVNMDTLSELLSVASENAGMSATENHARAESIPTVLRRRWGVTFFAGFS
jgi:hypothetical protein